MSGGRIEHRLRASVKNDAVNGDSFDRGVCARQMVEAAEEIERLREIVARLDAVVEDLAKRAERADG